MTVIGGRASADVGGSRPGLDCRVDRSVEGIGRRRPPRGEWRSISAADADGRQRVGEPRPGDLRRAPWTGSYIPNVPCSVTRAPRLGRGEKAERAG